MTGKNHNSDNSHSNDALEHLTLLRAAMHQRNSFSFQSNKSTNSITFAGLELFRQETIEEVYVEMPVEKKPIIETVMARVTPKYFNGKDYRTTAGLATLVGVIAFAIASFFGYGLAALPLIVGVVILVEWMLLDNIRSNAKSQTMNSIEAKLDSNTTSLIDQTKTEKVVLAAFIDRDVDAILKCKNLADANTIAESNLRRAKKKLTNDDPLYSFIEYLVAQHRSRDAEKLSKRYLELL